FKGPPAPHTARELEVPHVAVVGMQLRVPEKWIFQPLLLAEPEQLLDVRTDVDLVLALPEHGHERDRWNLLDARAKAVLSGAQLCLGGRSRIGVMLAVTCLLAPGHVLDIAAIARQHRGRELIEKLSGSLGGLHAGELGKQLARL